ncbi:hypothetical protein PFICI_01907 [Pestalotiopsis fici W106-1]|uniref:Uncharacterized protein n=1 Tax=Pestalotiopsis fici (strain W106-1 / CGMCC3.15140) TaxID=1229662 RepID=W3XQ11_PESFW|nr:uncharacterized protein PFICI_01907 [Pestalotiopsis fici W106-1]ETS88079.1 hypothetical protein PFICI_01907 [Pestalotiopsis fici W106-1]
MKFLATLLSLAATASAIDLYLHTNNNCGDDSLRCNGLNPDTCCGFVTSSSPYQSIAVRGIPSGWNLQGRGYDGNNCNRLQTVSGNNGNDWICNRSNGFRYTGAGYNFVGRKRAEGAGGAASNCQRPNALVLANGTEYDLTTLEDPEFEELIATGFDIEKSAETSQKLQPLRIK